MTRCQHYITDTSLVQFLYMCCYLTGLLDIRCHHSKAPPSAPQAFSKVDHHFHKVFSRLTRVWQAPPPPPLLPWELLSSKCTTALCCTTCCCNVLNVSLQCAFHCISKQFKKCILYEDYFARMNVIWSPVDPVSSKNGMERKERVWNIRKFAHRRYKSTCLPAQNIEYWRACTQKI